jgi:hypothetical protein
MASRDSGRHRGSCPPTLSANLATTSGGMPSGYWSRRRLLIRLPSRYALTASLVRWPTGGVAGAAVGCAETY